MSVEEARHSCVTRYLRVGNVHAIEAARVRLTHVQADRAAGDDRRRRGSDGGSVWGFCSYSRLSSPMMSSSMEPANAWTRNPPNEVSVSPRSPASVDQCVMVNSKSGSAATWIGAVASLVTRKLRRIGRTEAILSVIVGDRESGDVFREVPGRYTANHIPYPSLSRSK